MSAEPTVYLAEPFSLQADILAHPARFKVCAIGRRWGKTEMAQIWAVTGALELGGLWWWVLPSFPMSTEIWRALKATLANVWVDKSEQDRRIDLPGGGAIVVKSADNPGALVGVGLTGLVIDEAARVRDGAVVWHESLRPTLSDTGGRALLISTPQGQNWFYHEWLRGVQGAPDYQSWQYATGTSPIVDPEEIEAARRELPARIFAQEYEATFSDESGVFRGVRACIAEPPAGPVAGRAYVMGIDFAMTQDFTAAVVIDQAARQVVAVDRFHRLAWSVQRDRLAALASRWGCRTILAEANSAGDPNIEEMQRSGLRVTPFVTTADSKREIIEALMLGFEREEIRIPPHPVLVSELEAYEAERLPSGRWRYSAPGNAHDDSVIALALAWRAAATPAGVGVLAPLGRPVHDAGRRQWYDRGGWARGEDVRD